MAELHVYLENGFDRDLVTISVNSEKHTKSGREHPLPGRARRGTGVELSGVELSAPRMAAVRIALPERGLAAEDDRRPSGHAVRPGGCHRGDSWTCAWTLRSRGSPR